MNGPASSERGVDVDAPQGMSGRITCADVAIRDLGKCEFPSPVAAHLGDGAMMFVGAADKVLVNDCLSDLSFYHGDVSRLPAFELAGPRNQVYFDPKRTRAGIVTCGGLCPGLNNVVRGLVFELWFGYGIKKIKGFRFGYEGMVTEGKAPLPLTPEVVDRIHHQGGTLLGSSRGDQEPTKMVDTLEAHGINVLFVIGGDGTVRGAMSIARECEARGSKVAVIGIPKTIDNDIHFIDRSFGFESAYSASVEVIRSAKVEALCARDGIGLVKLMGRHSGFVACHAALASTDVDLVLIPEVPIAMDGDRGAFAYIERVLDRQGHAVIVVAEGAGQELFDRAGQGKDKSGNLKLKDIGVYMRDAITTHFKARGRETTLKYIDPSYQIRSVPASPSDSVYCWNMARNAVHAAMAGNTEMLIGRWHGRFVHVPMQLATRSQKHVMPSEDLWMSVVESTGQPRLFG